VDGARGAARRRQGRVTRIAPIVQSQIADGAARGAQGIPLLFLRNGGPAVHSALLSLYNFSWVHGVLPLDWRSAHVVALYKGKGDRSQPTNYRPISLTSIAVRTLECLIHARLYPFAEERGLLSAAQFGFRHHRSTADAVFVLTEWVKELLSNDYARTAPVAFLDLTKAYDKTWHAGLLFRLAEGGVTGRAFGWIKAFLARRRFRIVAGEACSLWHDVKASVPQGAVLSPLLFAIFLDPIVKLFSGPEFLRPTHHGAQRIASRTVTAAENDCGPVPLRCAIRIQLFADDIALMADARLDGWQQCFQLALDRVAQFAQQWRLSFSLDGGKSAVVLFQRASPPKDEWLRAAVRPISFSLCGAPLSVVPCYKYLGVWLQRSLDWSVHLRHLQAKARFAAFQVQRLLPRIRSPAAAGPVGGPHFSAVRALVLGGVYSRATFGCMFISGIGVEAKMRQLQSTVVRPLRQSLGLPGSAHIHSILVESDCPTLAIYRQQLLLSFARRVQRLGADHPSKLQFDRFQRRAAAAPVDGPTSVALCRRPLLLDVQEAERRFGVKVLSPAPAPLPPTAHGEPFTFWLTRNLEPGESIADARQIAPSHFHPQLIAQRPQPSPSPQPSASLSISNSPGASGIAASPSASESADSISCLSALARKVSFSEWKLLPDSAGGAILRATKVRPGRSLYLYMEPRATAVVRARLRFNRCSLNESLHKRALSDSPICAHPPCSRTRTAETVQHALLQCPLYSSARAACANQLRRAGEGALSLSTLLGQVDLKKANSPSFSAGPPPVVPPSGPSSRLHARGSIRSVWQPNGGLPRPVAAEAVPSERRTAERQSARRILFITAAFLRHVRIARGGLL